MKRRWFAATAVLAALAALVVYKEIHRTACPATAQATTSATPSVVLVADPREADSACGCGEIIRMVRAAAATGVPVREAAPGSDTSREYHATVNPTVLFLDRSGIVVARYEGESASTIRAIHARLEEVRSR